MKEFFNEFIKPENDKLGEMLNERYIDMYARDECARCETEADVKDMIVSSVTDYPYCSIACMNADEMEQTMWEQSIAKENQKND